MASLNKVLLIGNLTRDPDVRMMTNGRPVCNFGLALNRSYKDAEGNRKDETTFIDVECFGPRAEAVGRLNSLLGGPFCQASLATSSSIW